MNKLILAGVQSLILDGDLDGNYQQELLELNNAIALYPNNIDLLWRLARAHFEIADQTENKDIHKIS